MFLNCGAGEDSWEFHGLQEDRSILKEISPQYSLKGLMLKLKLQYSGHLMRRTDSCEKTLMLGKIWRKEEKGRTKDEMVGWHHRLNGPEFEQAPGVKWWTGKPGMLQSMGSPKSRTRLSGWTELKDMPELLSMTALNIKEVCTVKRHRKRDISERSYY